MSPEKEAKELSFNQNIKVDLKQDIPSGNTIQYPVHQSQRYLQVMQSNLFLFENELLKNITDFVPDINKKVEFYEKCIKLVYIESFDLVRKFAWILSKLYNKKSLGTHTKKNINQAMYEI